MSQPQIPANISSLPYEIQALILANVPIEDIINFCRSSVSYRTICQNDTLWQILTTQRFGQVTKSSGDDWFKTYLKQYHQFMLNLLAAVLQVVHSTFSDTIRIDVAAIGSPDEEFIRRGNNILNKIGLSVDFGKGYPLQINLIGQTKDVLKNQTIREIAALPTTYDWARYDNRTDNLDTEYLNEYRKTAEQYHHLINDVFHEFGYPYRYNYYHTGEEGQPLTMWERVSL